MHFLLEICITILRAVLHPTHFFSAQFFLSFSTRFEIMTASFFALVFFIVFFYVFNYTFATVQPINSSNVCDFCVCQSGLVTCHSTTFPGRCMDFDNLVGEEKFYLIDFSETQSLQCPAVCQCPRSKPAVFHGIIELNFVNKARQLTNQ